MLKDPHPLLDVRSEIEFAEGHIPNSINIPILNTEERIQVGTAYKNQGPTAALELGHKLVSGSVKEMRIQAWIRAIEDKNAKALICFRGGLRSQLAQSWCKDAGLEVPRIQGGTKALRNFLISELEKRTSKSRLIVISGATGAGKSLLLRELKEFKPCLDLEKIAHHRGSAFGGYNEPQPTPVLFENLLSLEIIHLESQIKLHKFVAIEDESRMIGRLALPAVLFDKIRAAPTLFVDEDINTRTQNTFDDYILNSDLSGTDDNKAKNIFFKYETSIRNISKKLGGLRTSEVLQDLLAAQQAFESHRDLEPNKLWIRKILEWYYDPLYFKSLESRNIKFKFKGSRKEVFDYLLKY